MEPLELIHGGDLSSRKPRVLVADDHHEILERVLSLLSANFEVVGAVVNGRDLVSEAHRLTPDIIVLDITMPILTGLEAARQLRDKGCSARLVFLTVHNHPEIVQACFEEGGLAYVHKSHMRSHLIPAIHQALSGQAFISVA